MASVEFDVQTAPSHEIRSPLGSLSASGAAQVLQGILDEHVFNKERIWSLHPLKVGPGPHYLGY